ncbi:MAG: HAMP domain-containing histidine kinase [Burkholderiales bacterium]|nr:HAMP domain-containing histidine kinase [Burkholderiales bacterium]
MLRVRRLYLRIWGAFVAILIAFGALSAAVWSVRPDPRDAPPPLDSLAGLVSEAMRSPPGAESRVTTGALQDTVDRLGERLHARISVWSADRQLLANAGPPLPPPPPERRTSGTIPIAGHGPGLALHLDDGRWVVVHGRPPPPWWRFAAMVAGLVVMTAGGAYLVARRITRRIERLKHGVEALGRGERGARVAVEGHDEVADLAASFNAAAERVEAASTAQKRLLAHASHELRSPLARLRMGLELLDASTRPDLAERMRRDIAELDTLIGEVLLASRLDADALPMTVAPVDLHALAVAVAADDPQVRVSGDAVSVDGDARLLRRLLGNLVDNARRHGGGGSIDVSVSRAADGAVRLTVADRGPGVPEAERERIFDAFHRVPGTPETSEGVGLGLALVRQIARAHGGDVRCAAREGGGSVFEVGLGSR